MKEMTVRIPADLQRELERITSEQGRSESELIVSGIRMLVQHQPVADPHLPSFGLFDSGDPEFASRTDELLEGFGEH